MNKAENIAPKAKKKKRPASLDARKARAGWFFVMPFVLAFVIIYLPIVFDSLKFSFSDLKVLQGGQGYVTTFVGFKNFSDALFVDSKFVQHLVSGVKQLLFDIPAIVIFSLFMAVLLNQKMLGRAAFRAIFFIPVIICTGVVDYYDQNNTMMSYLTDSSSSIDTGTGASANESLAAAANLDWLFGNMAVGSELAMYVTSIIANVYNIISRSGVQMLIFLAGLQSISPAIYESCQIDGAAAWETFWKITFPMISPMILVNAVYTIIDSFTASSNEVMMYIDSIYQEPNGQTLSSAMSWIYFLIVIIMVAVVAGLVSAYTFYQRRD